MCKESRRCSLDILKSMKYGDTFLVARNLFCSKVSLVISKWKRGKNRIKFKCNKKVEKSCEKIISGKKLYVCSSSLKLE